jgi:hypothetical protein
MRIPPRLRFSFCFSSKILYFERKLEQALASAWRGRAAGEINGNVEESLTAVAMAISAPL